MQLIITEKPSVAKDIAKVLKLGQKKDGYLYGPGYIVSWAFGHLVQLAHAQAYNPKYEKWNLDDLPIIPKPFITEVHGDSGIKKQFNILKTLLNHKDVTEVICATDAGREGELIFRHIYEKSACQKPIKRLWISSQTNTAIKEGFDNLKDGQSYQSLYESALSRSEADWLIGINATRAYTRKFSFGNGVMSVGRVQTPVLKMIVDRFKENRDFNPETYYEIEAKVSHENGDFTAIWINEKKESRLKEKAQADAIVKEVSNHPNGKITALTKKDITEKAPLLYDLTEVQKDANKRFKLSADDTLKTMQALYERHKILSYPRTSSRYLSTDIKAKIPALLANLSDLDFAQPFVDTLLANPLRDDKRLFDDSKVTDHHAIIPTDKKPDTRQLSDIEFKVYQMVIQRFLASFMPNCQKETSEILSQFGNHTFKANGTIIRKAGWRAVYANEKDTSKKKKDSTPLLPAVLVNDPITAQKVSPLKKQTKAPPLYTEASILAAMETAGKEIDDDEARQAMKDCGLGTPATRAQILEKLIRVSYIERKKTSLIPTQKGIDLIGLVQDPELLSPELTGTFEKKLNQIVNGDYNRPDYMQEIITFSKRIIQNVKAAEVTRSYIPPNPLGQCPICKEGLIGENKKSFGCNKWKESGCKFVIWKEIAKKKISESMAKKLIKNGETQVLKGFTSRAGKPFDAALYLDNGKVSFKFPPRDNAPPPQNNPQKQAAPA